MNCLRLIFTLLILSPYAWAQSIGFNLSVANPDTEQFTPVDFDQRVDFGSQGLPDLLSPGNILTFRLTNTNSFNLTNPTITVENIQLDPSDEVPTENEFIVFNVNNSLSSGATDEFSIEFFPEIFGST